MNHIVGNLRPLEIHDRKEQLKSPILCDDLLEKSIKHFADDSVRIWDSSVLIKNFIKFLTHGSGWSSILEVPTSFPVNGTRDSNRASPVGDTVVKLID